MHKQEFGKRGQFILKELAKLETMDWSANPEIASSIFPYVLVEAINIILNSTPNENVVDYMKTGEEVSKVIEGLIDGSFKPENKLKK